MMCDHVLLLPLIMIMVVMMVMMMMMMMMMTMMMMIMMMMMMVMMNIVFPRISDDDTKNDFMLDGLVDESSCHLQ